MMRALTITLGLELGRTLLDAVMEQRSQHENDAQGSAEGSYAYNLHTGIAEDLELIESALREAGCDQVMQ